MSKAFRVNIVTLKDRITLEVTYLKLKDESGYFGIMANHTEFLTIVEPGLGVYHDQKGDQKYLATDGGFLFFNQGSCLLTVYEIFLGDSPEELANQIREHIRKRKEREEHYRKLIKEIEEAYLKKTLEVYKT